MKYIENKLSLDGVFFNDIFLKHSTPVYVYSEKAIHSNLESYMEKIDDGDIFKQLSFSLDGSLDDIFDRIITLGFAASYDIINNNFTLTKQNEDNATYCKRRKPKDSEITFNELRESSAQFLHNKIRMLNDPYPNAYIVTSDKKKLYLLKSRL